jgi:hypothetical protein
MFRYFKDAFMRHTRFSALGRVQSQVALLLLVLSLGAQSATFFVGTGAGCNFNNIQSGINAAATNPGPDVVRISNATTWGPGGVTIGQQDVTVDGRFATCSDTVVNGNYAQIVGNATNPDARLAMFTISGSGVRRLQGLQIRNNVRGVSSFGGAITYSGTGELILSDMDVRDNRAENGGAIASSGSGILTLSENVLIESNIADRSGGGMVILGSSVLYAIGSNLSIANNEAYWNGGGIRVVQARAFIASPGRGSNAVLQSNRAAISFDGGSSSAGGAIFADIDSQVVVFSVDPNRPTRIAGNRAREKGGAIYLDEQWSTTSATLCLMDVHLSGNSANGGAALYADVDNGANSNMIYNVPARDECVVPANAPAQPVRCNRTAAGCNVIEGHITQTISGTPSGGGVVTARKNIELLMRDASFVNNTAGFMINSDEADRVELNTALITANTAISVMRLGFAAVNQGLVMRNVTIAGNTIASSNPSVRLDAVPGTPASVNFNNNLIFQPGRTAVTAAFGIGTSAATNWDFNATNAPQVLPNPSQLVLSDARFENAAFNDYRLKIGSLAVNAFAAGSVLNASLDLDGRSRPITLDIFAPDVSNVDVGAFERQEADPWLVNGGFSVAAQLRYWEPSANGEAIPGVFWDAQDAAGNPNSGSALVNLPTSLATRLTVLRRCFNVPAPGRYTITAKALRGNPPNSDDVALRWNFRENDTTCSSAGVQGSGEVAFARGSGFQSLATPLEINLPLLSTTANSTIEIRLDALTGLNLNGLTNIRFDDISIIGVPLLPDAIFADGFD